MSIPFTVAAGTTATLRRVSGRRRGGRVRWPAGRIRCCQRWSGHACGASGDGPRDDDGRRRARRRPEPAPDLSPPMAALDLTAHIRPGDTVVVGGATGEPRALIEL